MSQKKGFLLISVVVLALSLVIGLTPGTAATTRPKARAATLPYEDPNLPVKDRVADLMGRMDLADKIGQMTQAERLAVDKDTSQIATYHLGSLLSGGGSTPTPNTPEAWADMVDRYQAVAMSTPPAHPADLRHRHRPR
jgi:beta-glucosidase